MIFRIWSFLKLIYLYIAYWFVGFEEEEFYIPKANYCADIGWYHTAIKAYKRSLDESDNPLIHSALGWCYAEVGINEKSVEHYRKAFSKNNCPEIAIGLAYAEYSVGNINEFLRIYEHLNSSIVDMNLEIKNQFENLTKLWEAVVKATESKVEV